MTRRLTVLTVVCPLIWCKPERIFGQVQRGGILVKTTDAQGAVIDAKTTNVNVNIDKAILDSTPGGKDIWSLLEYKAPGVIFDSPSVGGNQGGLQRALYARGTPNDRTRSC
jgi:hypothetical protein